MSRDSRKVFIVHGRNDRVRNAMFTFLRSIGLNPIEWGQAVQITGNPVPFIGEVLDNAFSIAQAVVVILTGDDEAQLNKRYHTDNDPEFEKRLTPQARPNVLFEAGLAFGSHPRNTVLIQLGKIRPFSDIAGRHVLQFGNSAQQRHQLSQRLQLAGCPVDLTGNDWYTAGDFSIDENDSSEGEVNSILERAQPAFEPQPGNKIDSKMTATELEKIRVLQVFGEYNGPVHLDIIIGETGLKPVKAEYYANQLFNEGLISHVEYRKWSLKHEGRKFLVEGGYV